tara:strand:+ start:692 stop:1183 length:492 start_codon:yes stop_codon:yes gene_type:complete
MILVNKDKTLYFKKKKYRCSVGLNGFTKNKIEGDKKTPIGTYSFGKLFVRTDKIKNLNTKFEYIPIRKDMAWSDDPNKSNYNQLIKTKNKHKESLYRNDNLYDLILVINYNINPVLPNKGSAIFLHVSRDDYTPTKGCVAIAVNDFIEILKTLKPDDKINILN